MDEIEEQIKQNRPNLSQGSLKTYKSLLKSIHSKCFPDTPLDIENFQDEDAILAYLKDVPYNKRKTTLAALVVLTGSTKYRDLMMEDLAEHNATELNQEQNEKQEQAMISFKEVKKVLNRYAKNAKELFSRDELTSTDIQQIQLYVLLCLTTGVYVPPRRSLDWVMKWRNYDTNTDNYYDSDKGIFVFNQFKTAKNYEDGQQLLVPKALKKILDEWLLYNPTDYILFGNTYEPLNSSQIAQRLNLIFDKQISTSMLRHIYLTSKYDNVNLKQMTELANNMAHSPMQALAYVKRKKQEVQENNL